MCDLFMIFQIQYILKKLFFSMELKIEASWPTQLETHLV
jgi:hypothetical protein